MSGLTLRAASALRVAEGRLLGLVMLTMVALYGLNVGIRELLPSYASDVAWIDEASRIALVWAVFLALGATLERGRHVAMTTLADRMPQGGRRVVLKTIDLIGLSFALYIVKVGVDITAFVLKSGQISPTLGVSMAWLYAALPIGFALLALRYALSLAGLLDRRRQPVGQR